MPIKTDEFRILLIDDDEDDFFHLQDLFKDIAKSKFFVTWKSSYQEGLQALKNSPYDACLLDYRLGEKNGLELLLEAIHLDLTCPIIFLTGLGDFDLDLQAMQMGAADYLVKSNLTAPLLERSIRYSIKHALDMQELKESKAQVLQQDRLASLGLLASSLAHEIGTPMGVIRSRAELVEKRLDSNEIVKQDMKIIVSQIDRISTLVNSLLQLARSKKSNQMRNIDLRTVIQDVLNLLQHEFSRKCITFKFTMDKEYTVQGEEGPLGQVLLNLLINSVHAIEAAKEKDTTRTYHIFLEVKDTEKEVRISVHDNGCGVAEQHISQLFKPFFTTKDVGQGTGLGLATSFRIVQSWGGCIEHSNPSPIGSTFTIKLLKGI